jgi:hypothetical protein
MICGNSTGARHALAGKPPVAPAAPRPRRAVAGGVACTRVPVFAGPLAGRAPFGARHALADKPPVAPAFYERG